MNKIFLIAQREFLENVRTKGFWISLLTMPFLMIAGFAVPALVEMNKGERTYAVLDREGSFRAAVAQRIRHADCAALFDQVRKAPPGTFPPALTQVATDLDQLALEGHDLDPLYAYLLGETQNPERDTTPWGEARRWWGSLSEQEQHRLVPNHSGRSAREIPLAPGTTEADLEKMVLNETLSAYFVIGPDPVNDPAAFRYASANLTDRDLLLMYQRFANQEVQARRQNFLGIEADLAQWISAETTFSEWLVSKDGSGEAQAEAKLAQWVPVGFVYLLWLCVFVVSMMMLTSTITEKSNRLVEVLLSSVSPLQLLAGKILGISATGLTSVGTWCLLLLLGMNFLPGLLGLDLGVELAQVVARPAYLLSFLVYFTLGYLLYGAILVGLGSVCDNLKDAQNMISPVSTTLFIPLLLMIPIGRDPNGLLARILSYIPPLTPFVMMNRAAGPPPLIDYVATSVLLALSVGLALWAAAKIFRVGILLTGKPPKLAELWRWIRSA